MKTTLIIMTLFFTTSSLAAAVIFSANQAIKKCSKEYDARACIGI